MVTPVMLPNLSRDARDVGGPGKPELGTPERPVAQGPPLVGNGRAFVSLTSFSNQGSETFAHSFI